MSNTSKLGWGDRLALIDKYEATDEQAAVAFDLPVEEIETAREIRSESGGANMPVNIDVDDYENPFSKIDGATSVRRPGTRTPAETATAITPAPKKRGRKGTKINEAFAAIGTTPVPAEEFATEHNVSLNVLRQAKRFDRTGLGKVRIKKIDGQLMAYRESE
jgi:hypothetical protein